jgi:hypothetical protein
VTLTRRNHGTGHSYELDGLWVPGVTTLISAGFPKAALVHWASKACANEVIDFWDELATLSISERFERVRSAPNRDRDAAARRGTEVHKIAQRLLANETVDVPEEIDGHVQSYLQFLADWDVRELLVETSVGRRDGIRYAGTLDLIADLRDRRRWLLDLKTTRSGVFEENALQLAGYRFAEFYVDDVGREYPMLKVDQCGVVWLRADGYDLYPVDAGEPEFLLFQMVARIARLADRRMREKLGGRELIGAPLQLSTLKEVTT